MRVMCTFAQQLGRAKKLEVVWLTGRILSAIQLNFVGKVRKYFFFVCDEASKATFSKKSDRKRTSYICLIYAKLHFPEQGRL